MSFLIFQFFTPKTLNFNIKEATVWEFGTTNCYYYILYLYLSYLKYLQM